MFNRVIFLAQMLALSACSGLGGPDYAGLQKQHEVCGTNATHFVNPQPDTLGPVPQGDAIGYDADPAKQKCLLDWAAAHGFKVLSTGEVQKLMQGGDNF